MAAKKPTEFCSAVVKSRHVHFACMKKSTAVHAGRGFCATHAPEFRTFYVYRFERGEIQKVLVFQRPSDTYSFHVVSPLDRTYGSRLWGRDWHRTRKAAANAPIAKALERVKDAKAELAEHLADLKKLRRLSK